VVVGEGVVAAEGRHDRQPQPHGELDQVTRGPGAEDAAAGDDERSPRALERRHDRRRVGRADGGRRRRRRGWQIGRDGGVEDVAAEGDGDRAGAPGDAAPEGLGDDRRQPLAGRGFDGPLRDLAEEGRELDLLQGFAVAERGLDLADEGEQRRGVLVGGVDADREVGGADAAGAHADGGDAGQLADRLGHEGGAALVAGADEADLGRLVQGVEKPQETLARHAEGVAHAALAEHPRRRHPGPDPCHHVSSSLARRVGADYRPASRATTGASLSMFGSVTTT
jgi:hypothetical protein